MFTSCELKLPLLRAAIILAGIAGSAGADGFVLNSGFENDVLALDAWVYHADAWIITGDAGTFHPPAAAYPGGAPFGSNVGFVQSGWGRPAGVLEQITPVILEAGMVCQLDAAIGRRIDNPLLPWGGYIMSLFAGDSLLSQQVTGVHPSAGTFAVATLTHVVDTESIGQPLRIRFEALFGQTNIDDVRLTVIPAPSALPLASLAGLYACRRRRGFHVGL